MWKQARESGVSLAELLVVLAITVVLAAILMPAINTPTHAGGSDPEAALDPYVVALDDYWAGTHPNRGTLSIDRERDEPVVNDASERDLPVEVAPAFNSGEVETLERDGLKEIKTTDISYKLP